MMRMCLLAMTLLALPGSAEERQRIYQTDPYGRTQHNKPSLLVDEKGYVTQLDPYGRPQPNKGGYQIKGDRVYEADPYGRPRYDKPSLLVKPEK